MDFFTVPTIAFKVLYGLVNIRLERRHSVHFNELRQERVGLGNR